MGQFMNQAKEKVECQEEETTPAVGPLAAGCHGDFHCCRLLFRGNLSGKGGGGVILMIAMIDDDGFWICPLSRELEGTSF